MNYGLDLVYISVLSSGHIYWYYINACLIVQMKWQLCSWNYFCYFLKTRKLPLTLFQQSLEGPCEILYNSFSALWEEQAVKITLPFLFLLETKVLQPSPGHRAVRVLQFEQQLLRKWGESSQSIWSLLLLLLLSTSVPFPNMSVWLYWEQNEVFSHN